MLLSFTNESSHLNNTGFPDEIGKYEQWTQIPSELQMFFMSPDTEGQI